MKATLNHTVPLYQRLVDDITSRIETGVWGVGAKLPSERELCQLYNVSQITVRRALRELAQAGHVYSHHGLGWFVGDLANSSAGLRDVTLLLPELDALSTQLLPHLVEALRPDLALRLGFVSGGQQECGAATQRAIAEGAAAVLLAVSGEERRLAEWYGAALTAEDAPVVLLYREVAGGRAPAVTIDEQGAVQRMTEYLLSMGHRRVAYVGDDPTLIEGQQRYRGFFGSLLEHGHELPMEWVFAGSLTDQVAGSRFTRVFSDALPPTAVVCGADERAAEVLALLGRLGIACPDQVAVVGLGDTPVAPLLSTPLTTFRFDLHQAASGAAAALRAALAGEEPQSVTVGGEVVQRASCGAAH